MGLFSWFRRPKGRWRTVREDFRDLPKEEWTDDEHDHHFGEMSEDEQWAQWDDWSKETAPHHRYKFVTRNVLDMALAAAADGHPKEFGCLIRVTKDTLTELILLPGSEEGEESVVFNLWMQPVDSSIRGSLHSHPTPHPYPSDADFEMFEAHGDIHLILCEPYGPDDWRCYDHRGQPVHLDVVDAPDPNDFDIPPRMPKK